MPETRQGYCPDDCHWWEDDHPESWQNLPHCACGYSAGAHVGNHPHGMAQCDGYAHPNNPTTAGDNTMTTETIIDPAYLTRTAPTATAHADTFDAAVDFARSIGLPRLLTARWEGTTQPSDYFELTRYEDNRAYGNWVHVHTDGSVSRVPSSQGIGRGSLGAGRVWWIVDTDVPAAAAPAAAPTLPAAATLRIPRTADEATRLATLLSQLALRLPGGSFNERGHDLARNSDLCTVYERVVTRVFGWEPRSGYGDYSDALEAWERDIARLERDHSGSYSDLLRSALHRYERGGTVNEAIIDAMRNNLESYKVPAVNEVLEACNMDGLPASNEYEVTFDVVRYVRQTQRVTITVDRDDEVSDEDEAIDLARDRVWDEVSDYDWDTDDYDATMEDVQLSHARIVD